MTITDADYAELKTEVARLKGRIALLERQIQFLLGHFNLEYVDNLPETGYADVAALKRQGNIIEAIKLYRLKTNAGLAEAKTFVDNLEI